VHGSSALPPHRADFHRSSSCLRRARPRAVPPLSAAATPTHCHLPDKLSTRARADVPSPSPRERGRGVRRPSGPQLTHLPRFRFPAFSDPCRKTLTSCLKPVPALHAPARQYNRPSPAPCWPSEKYSQPWHVPLLPEPPQCSGGNSNTFGTRPGGKRYLDGIGGIVTEGVGHATRTSALRGTAETIAAQSTPPRFTLNPKLAITPEKRASKRPPVEKFLTS